MHPRRQEIRFRAKQRQGTLQSLLCDPAGNVDSSLA